MNFNKVLIGGRLTRDPELKFTPKGTAVCKLGLATSRKWKTESGEAKEDKVFIDVDCFGKQAEHVAQFFRKGSNFFGECRLKMDEWDDKATGQKRSKIGLFLENFQIIDPKPTGDSAPARAPRASTAAQAEDQDPPF